MLIPVLIFIAIMGIAVLFGLFVWWLGSRPSSQEATRSQATGAADNPTRVEQRVVKRLNNDNAPVYVAPYSNPDKPNVYTIDDFKKDHPEFGKSSNKYSAPTFDNL